MVRVALIILLLAANACFVFAQPPTIRWTRTIGTVADEWAISVKPLADGGFVLTGQMHMAEGTDDIILIRLDEDGGSIWRQDYEMPFNEEVKDVIELSDGGYLVGGATDALYWHGNPFLIRTNSSGDTLWTRIFTEDDGIVLGMAESDDSMNIEICYSLGDYGGKMERTDQEGLTTWSEYLSPGIPWYVTATAAVAVPRRGGGWVVAGNGFFDPPEGESFNPMWILWVDAMGYEMNMDMGLYGCIAVDLTQSWQDGYILLWHGNWPSTLTSYMFNGGYQGWYWQRSISRQGTKVRRAADSGYVVFVDGGYLRLDREGYERQFVNLGEQYNCNLRSVELCADNGYLFAGEVNSSDSGRNIFLIRTNPDTGSLDITHGFASLQDRPMLTASPNPFNPRATIAFELADATRARLSVFDLQGRHVATLYDGFLNQGTHEEIFEASGYSSGIYFAVLESNHRKVVQKLVLLK